MKALVTGVAGFIGSTLARRLLSEGSEVVGIDSLTTYYDPILKTANISDLQQEGLTFVRGDLNVVDLRELIAGHDVIYHLAGQPGVRRSWGDSFNEYVTANVSATQRLLEAVRRMNEPPRVVFASSSSIYGDAEAFPTDEQTTPRPRSPYGVTKLAAEHLCNLYASNYSLRTASLRFFTVYGPRQRPDMAFTRFLTAAETGRSIEVYGSGEQVRDFTFVDDIVEALHRTGSADIAPGTVMNVSGGGSHSVNEVLEVIGRLVGRPLTIERGAVALGDVSRTTADITAAKRLLGWSPTTSLDEGLEAQLHWVRDSLRR